MWSSDGELIVPAEIFNEIAHTIQELQAPADYNDNGGDLVWKEKADQLFAHFFLKAPSPSSQAFLLISC